ncbi:MAG: tRNA pseudouridine(13) synthase TruD [Anaerolineae bacterium]|nr:tRNA pseudouridine(13) synthase TruD [Anaerolineae bacterium]
MRYKERPEDFVVEERARLHLVPRGDFAVYRVRKRGVTTLDVQAQVARALGVGKSDVVFPALKDKDAVAVQHVAVRIAGAVPSPQLSGEGFEARFLGHSPRPLTPGDIAANRFTIVLRDLSAQDVARVHARSAQMARSGLPNYFDEQRFGSLAPGEDHIAKRVLQRDAEGALRAYLAQPFVGDPAPVRKFKAFAAGHWGDWDALFEAAPRPSNFRSVLTYLRDHPTGDPLERAMHHRKALNLITQRLLSIYLSAYQSMLWNRIAGRYLEALGRPSRRVEIAGEQFPLYDEWPSQFDRGVAIPLPNHQASYAGPDLAAIAIHVLEEEGLELDDLKARILKRAYLPKGKRALLLFPEGLSCSPSEPDERFPGRHRVTAAFTLPRGSYATLVLKALGA